MLVMEALYTSNFRIGGHLILKSIFVELRKDIHADVVATIDRDE